MSGDQKPQPAGDSGVPEAGDGWTALAYLIGGLVVWGFAGWLVDRWLDTGGLAIGIAPRSRSYILICLGHCRCGENPPS